MCTHNIVHNILKSRCGGFGVRIEYKTVRFLCFLLHHHTRGADDETTWTCAGEFFLFRFIERFFVFILASGRIETEYYIFGISRVC